MSDLTRISIEHRNGCFAVENDPDGCTCEPIVLMQIGGKDRGWSPAAGALPRGWMVAEYDQLLSWVEDHQRPNTDAEYAEIVRQKLAELRGDQPGPGDATSM
jgi:hypothetical protein